MIFYSWFFVENIISTEILALFCEPLSTIGERRRPSKFSYQRKGLSMKLGLRKNSKVIYLAFCIPFILAYASWRFFPTLANWLITQTFKYNASLQQASWLWYAVIGFFYGWYTFLAIGVAGVWAVAATLAKVQKNKVKRLSYPMVSFVVPAYNEEKNVSRCIKSLFKCTEKYAELCEIIVVDDGSSDYTYEIAWASIELNRRRYPQVRGKVVRHSANLGKVEAIKTGSDRALGSLIAVVDADSC